MFSKMSFYSNKKWWLISYKNCFIKFFLFYFEMDSNFCRDSFFDGGFECGWSIVCV